MTLIDNFVAIGQQISFAGGYELISNDFMRVDLEFLMVHFLIA